MQEDYLLLQVGRVAKDQEPSDRHWVVSESLVSYPARQLYVYDSPSIKLSCGMLAVFIPSEGIPQKTTINQI